MSCKEKYNFRLFANLITTKAKDIVGNSCSSLKDYPGLNYKSVLK